MPLTMFTHWLCRLMCIVALGLSGQAAIVEEVIDVRVQMKSPQGQDIDQPIKVTIFRDDSREKAPYLILNHGRAGDAVGRANLKRARYSENSRYFVSKGFVVLVPTRIGYGETGGPDVEDSGPCDDRKFAPAYAAAAKETMAVIKTAEKLAYVDLSRGVVAGQSFGGMTAITLSSMKFPGMLGAINFAGGGGGNPKKRPGNPCSADRLLKLFEEYGAASSIPTLWLYSENDRYWGPDLPGKWCAAFVAAGGKAEFTSLPAHGEDGHSSFTANPDAWKPAFEKFIRELGFRTTP
jgi:dienelactone hydrolase